MKKITVLGKLADTDKYACREGYNVLSKFDGWTPEFNREWLRQVVERGDDILIVSTLDVSGQFRNELEDLMEILLERQSARLDKYLLRTTIQKLQAKLYKYQLLIDKLTRGKR